MKHRVLPLLLVFALILSPALAAEPDGGFSDVAADAWYAPYVDVCVEAGLMVGTGEGAFSPEATLTGNECVVLALRLHDLLQGGDGVFEKAPEDWGYATFTFPDGKTVQGYLRDQSVWQWVRFSRVDTGHLSFSLKTQEEQDWGLSMDYQKAVFSMNGVTCSGELHLSGPTLLYFEPRDYSEFHDLTDATYPVPTQWFRDAWYYAERHDLQWLTYRTNSRYSFAEAIFTVTGELPAINDIFALPDAAEECVLSLCRAGVLTGTDPYGTFHQGDTLTRAQGAAILARVLRPELRRQYTVLPLETYESYTLTYLREDGERPYGPYRPMQSETLLVPDDHTLLRLDGVEFAAPEGYEFQTVGNDRAGLSASFQSTAQGYGFLDSQGQFREATRDEVYALPRHPDVWELHNGYSGGLGTSIFYDAQGRQVTPAFSWIGVINSEGAGFVGLEGKIYRIQFEK